MSIVPTARPHFIWPLLTVFQKISINLIIYGKKLNTIQILLRIFGLVCSLNGFIDNLGNEKIVKRLIEKGADVNAQTDELITPLGYAASGGNFEKDNC